MRQSDVRCLPNPLSWSELLKRTAKESSEDDVFDLAAQLAYYCFLALFPAVLFILALASFFPLTNSIAVGDVIVLLLWFYLSGLAILIGAELNAEIEHASPYGKDPGEKVPGQKKQIGAGAARAYNERLASRQGTAPIRAARPQPAAVFQASRPPPSASWESL